MKKTIIVLIVFLVVCMSLCGCTAKPDSNESGTLPKASVNNELPHQSDDPFATGENQLTNDTIPSMTQEVLSDPVNDGQQIQPLEVDEEVEVTYDAGVGIGGN